MNETWKPFVFSESKTESKSVLLSELNAYSAVSLVWFPNKLLLRAGSL